MHSEMKRGSLNCSRRCR